MANRDKVVFRVLFVDLYYFERILFDWIVVFYFIAFLIISDCSLGDYWILNNVFSNIFGGYLWLNFFLFHFSFLVCFLFFLFILLLYLLFLIFTLFVHLDNFLFFNISFLFLLFPFFIILFFFDSGLNALITCIINFFCDS